MTLFTPMTISKSQTNPKNRYKRKTHEFTVTLLGWVAANNLWSPQSKDKAAWPTFIAYTATEQTSKAAP